MRSYLLDSNALVYWLYPGSPFNGDVSSFLREALVRDHDVYVLSSCLNEVYYALHSHYMGERAARSSIAIVADVLTLVDLTREVVDAALASDEPDYEDGLVRAVAEAFEVDAIITYDRKAFRGSSVAKRTAAEALADLRSEE